MVKLSSFCNIRRVKRCPGRDLSIAALADGYLAKNSVRHACRTAVSAFFAVSVQHCATGLFSHKYIDTTVHDGGMWCISADSPQHLVREEGLLAYKGASLAKRVMQNTQTLHAIV